jgi:hypothetical protein
MIATSATSQNWQNPVANPPTSQKLENNNNNK